MYEIHITCLTSESQPATYVAKELHWKTSEIARDPVLGKDTYFYLTKYAKSHDLALAEIAVAMDMLRSQNVKVLREKIEHIVHDIRYV